MLSTPTDKQTDHAAKVTVNPQTLRISFVVITLIIPILVYLYKHWNISTALNMPILIAYFISLLFMMTMLQNPQEIVSVGSMFLLLFLPIVTYKWSKKYPTGTSITKVTSVNYKQIKRLSINNLYVAQSVLLIACVVWANFKVQTRTKSPATIRLISTLAITSAVLLYAYGRKKKNNLLTDYATILLVIGLYAFIFNLSLTSEH